MSGLYETALKAWMAGTRDLVFSTDEDTRTTRLVGATIPADIFNELGRALLLERHVRQTAATTRGLGKERT